MSALRQLTKAMFTGTHTVGQVQKVEAEQSWRLPGESEQINGSLSVWWSGVQQLEEADREGPQGHISAGQEERFSAYHCSKR